MSLSREALAFPLVATALLATGPMVPVANAQANDNAPTLDTVFAEASRRADALASYDYQAPSTWLPPAFTGQDYDGYRRLRPRPEATIWGRPGAPFGVLPLPRGGLYNERVAIHLVTRKGVESFASPAFVDFVDYPEATDRDRHTLGASGWRAITRPGVAGDGYEFAVFQGGAYFRAVGQGQFYGVSARALALNTGSPAGEEFPRFTDFWILEPEASDDTLRFVALSDSPSAAAVYRFALRPGSDAIIDVTAEIHPRIDVSETGVAPLSSMFLKGPVDPRAGANSGKDKRPEVHDSDGLSILTASGEAIWRPLANPAQVQMSAFAGAPVRFGLEQRQRSAAAYSDGEAKYERRPSVVIEPTSDWGAGDIRLLEIPTANEYADNVAAYWRPAQVWRAGETHTISYRLHWSNGSATQGPARVVSSAVALAPETSRIHRFTISFEAGAALPATLTSDVWGSAGAITNVRVARESDRRARLSFDLEPGNSPVVELHAALTGETSHLTETWLFRWTPN